jgi:hypothetical protein
MTVTTLMDAASATVGWTPYSSVNILNVPVSITKCICQLESNPTPRSTFMAITKNFIPPIVLTLQIIIIAQHYPKTTLSLFLAASTIPHIYYFVTGASFF